MAKLRRRSVSQDGHSDGSDFHPFEEETTAKATMTKIRSSPRKLAQRSYLDVEYISSEDSEYATKPVSKTKPNANPSGRQIRLAPLNTRLLSKTAPDETLPGRSLYELKGSIENKTSKANIRLKQRSPKAFTAVKRSPSIDSSAEIAAEESIWCGHSSATDDSEEELPSPRKFVRRLQRASDLRPEPEAQDHLRRLKTFALPDSAEQISSVDQTVKFRSIESVSSRPTSSSDKENNAAFLQYSPPRLYSNPKQTLQDRPVTPPQSPAKSRLQSPSKTKSRLAAPPLRQSLDAFWNSNTVNDWNDEHSPQKILKSPKKLKFLRDDASVSPTGSPRKGQSPSKSTRAEREAKKDFESRKRGIAKEFLEELDSVVTKCEIQKLSASTGGVRFVWSKTLNSTAGRANWRKETTRTRKMDGTIEIEDKHHASIELAEKVIDDENRLLNVIAHEYCHLANFMISGIKDQPHGRQFKEWGRKCTQAFKHRGVEVTTKHSYQIEYKYVWQCSSEDCAVEFKRHSKSIDPKRHTCGTCRSKLVQIKPAPRKDAGNGSGYAGYVKANFAQVKRGMVGASQKEVMEAVGRKYRAEKAAGKDALPNKGLIADVNQLVSGLEVITLADD